MPLACGNNTQIIQYADDSVILCCGPDPIENAKILSQECEKVVRYLSEHKLRVNVSKTEYVNFTRKANATPMELTIREKTDSHETNQIIREKPEVKYLGVVLDKKLDMEAHCNGLLRNMACGIKTIYAIRDHLTVKSNLIIMKSLVMSHLMHSITLLTNITEKTKESIDAQLSWALKACCHEHKTASTTALRLKHKLLPFSGYMNQRSLLYFWKLERGLLTSFQQNQFPRIH